MKQLLLRNCAVDFVEICNVYVGKMIIKATKRIFNSDKICRSYSDLNFGVTFIGTQCTFSGISLVTFFYSTFTNVFYSSHFFYFFDVSTNSFLNVFTSQV